MKECFGYIRVSTQKQGLGVSLQEQKDAILAFAKSNKLDVVEWFEEKETAAKTGRRIFNQMLKRLKRGHASGMIVHAIDRSARNLKDWAIVSELPEQGIEVFIAKEHLDFTSRGGRLTGDMLAVIAADFIRNQREETKKGLRGRLKQGLYPFRAPIGYIDNGRGNAKTPCPMKAPLIAEMFELYASGQHSMRSLHAYIGRRGLKNLSNRTLSMHGVETILKNPFYTGIIEIKRTGESFQGVHEPVISSSVFKRAQDVRLGRCGVKVTRHNHLFQGLFRCGLCTGAMSPERQKGHVYYRCKQVGCATKTIREELLSAHIFRTLRVLQFSPTDADKLRRKWNAHKTKSNIGSEHTRLTQAIVTVRAKLERAADLLLEGALDNETYQNKRLDLQMELTHLEEQLNSLPSLSETERHVNQFAELMISLAGLYNSTKRAEKRVLVENTFANRLVIGKEPVLEPFSWAEEAKIALPVPFGDPYRYKDRTLGDSKELQRVMRLLADNDDLLDEAA